MGILGSPPGGGFLGPPSGAGDPMFESLAANVLRSLQFSYFMMKGFSSTSRVLKDLGRSSEGGLQGSGGSSEWRGSGSLRLRLKFRGGRAGMGRLSVSRRGRGDGRRPNCANDSYGARPTENGCVGEKSSGNPNHGDGGRMRKPGRPIATEKESAFARSDDVNGDLASEGSVFSGMAEGEARLAQETVLVRRFTSGLTNRTLSVTGLAAVDGVSHKLKPMGKGFAKGVKMATGVVKGVKTATGVLQKFQAPAEGVLMGFGAANGVALGYEAAKFIVSGAKMSKNFASVFKFTKNYVSGAASAAGKNPAGDKVIRERLMKGLKVSDGALTLVKLTKEFGSAGLGSSFPGGLSSWDLITKGYEASNSLLKVSEATLGFKGGISVLGKFFLGLKGAIGGTGVVVKSVFLTKEISLVLLKGVGLWKGLGEVFKAVSEGKTLGDVLMFRGASKDNVEMLKGEYVLEIATVVFRKGVFTNPNFFELPLKLLNPRSATGGDGSRDASSSLFASLASLLLAHSQADEAGDPDDNGSTYSRFSWSYLFYLSLPS